ncbi:hypothetical protein EON62_02130, partial [archaeon]
MIVRFVHGIARSSRRVCAFAEAAWADSLPPSSSPSFLPSARLRMLTMSIIWGAAALAGMVALVVACWFGLYLLFKRFRNIVLTPDERSAPVFCGDPLLVHLHCDKPLAGETVRLVRWGGDSAAEVVDERPPVSPDCSLEFQGITQAGAYRVQYMSGGRAVKEVSVDVHPVLLALVGSEKLFSHDTVTVRATNSRHGVKSDELLLVRLGADDATDTKPRTQQPQAKAEAYEVAFKGSLAPVEPGEYEVRYYKQCRPRADKVVIARSPPIT